MELIYFTFVHCYLIRLVRIVIESISYNLIQSIDIITLKQSAYKALPTSTEKPCSMKLAVQKLTQQN